MERRSPSLLQDQLGGVPAAAAKIDDFIDQEVLRKGHLLGSQELVEVEDRERHSTVRTRFTIASQRRAWFDQPRRFRELPNLIDLEWRSRPSNHQLFPSRLRGLVFKAKPFELNESVPQHLDGCPVPVEHFRTGKR